MKRVLLSLALICGLVSQVNAAVTAYQYTISGLVDFSSFSSVNIGDAFSASMIFEVDDTELIGLIPSPTTLQHFEDGLNVLSAGASLGANSFGFTSMFAQVRDDVALTGSPFGAFGTSDFLSTFFNSGIGSLGGLDVLSLNIFQQASSSELSNFDYLPALTADYDLFNGFQLDFDNPSGSNLIVRGTLDSVSLVEVTNVPIPAAAWFFGSAIFSMAGVRKLQKR